MASIELRCAIENLPKGRGSECLAHENLAAEVGNALGEELCAQPVGLQECALGQLVAADAIVKAEVVLDLRAGTRLSTDGEGLDD